MLGPVALAEPTTNKAKAADTNSDLTIFTITAHDFGSYNSPQIGNRANFKMI
jgi:hypothetical protein